MPTGRSNKLTGQIAEHLVCAELGRRGMIATSFAGNVPDFDIVAVNEAGNACPIQVKGANTDNWTSDSRKWMKLAFDPDQQRQIYSGEEEITLPDLIYVHVLIADAKGRQTGSLVNDRFFILTKAQLQKVIVKGHAAWMKGHEWRRPVNPESFHCSYKIKDLECWEDRWDLLTERLSR